MHKHTQYHTVMNFAILGPGKEKEKNGAGNGMSIL